MSVEVQQRQEPQNLPNESISFDDDGQMNDIQDNLWSILAETIRGVGKALAPDKELENLSEAEATINYKNQTRDAELDALRQKVAEQKRHLAQVTQSAKRPVENPREKFEEQVRTLQQQQHLTRKQLNEEQSNIISKEEELVKWKGNRVEVDEIVVGDDEQPSACLIRLQMLRDVGFTYVPSRNDSAAKVMIRNQGQTDIHTITLDGKRPKAYVANSLWTLASD